MVISSSWTIYQVGNNSFNVLYGAAITNDMPAYAVGAINGGIGYDCAKWNGSDLPLNNVPMIH
jgi:hypothetical protein